MTDCSHSCSLQSEQGFSLLEILVAMILAATVTTGIALNLATAMKIGKTTEAHFAASTLANSRIESLAAVDALDLDNSYNEVDTVVNFPGLNTDFHRTTTVVANADDSRTITVTVESATDAFPTSVTFRTTLAAWE